MKPLKPGDKVAIYNVGVRTIGLVNSLNRDGRIAVAIQGVDFVYHRKQLRLITKKEKPATRQPRRLWVNVYDRFRLLEGAYFYSSKELAESNSASIRIECVEFVEVMKEGE